MTTKPILAAASLAAVFSMLAPAAADAARGGIKPPTLAGGVLTVEGTGADDTLAVRVSPTDPGVIQIDAANGTILFNFPRAGVAQIVVHGRGGNDSLRVDQSGGLF